MVFVDKGPFTRSISMSVSVPVTIKVYHCVNDDRPLDRQTGFEKYSVCQRKSDGDGDRNRDGTCK